MHDIDAGIRLDQLINEHPSLARELERLGLDYCCGGTRPLSLACSEQGLDVKKVAATLRDIAASSGVEVAPWMLMGVTQLVDHLEQTHHRYLWDELPRLADLAETVVSAHAARHPELLGVRDTIQLFRAEIQVHLQVEETEVFPMMRELVTAEELLGGGSIAAPISSLHGDHDVAGELLVTLRELTDGFRPPDDGCASFWTLYDALRHMENDVHLHVHKENNVLFPAVVSIERRLIAKG